MSTNKPMATDTALRFLIRTWMNTCVDRVCTALKNGTFARAEDVPPIDIKLPTRDKPEWTITDYGGGIPPEQLAQYVEYIMDYAGKTLDTCLITNVHNGVHTVTCIKRNARGNLTVTMTGPLNVEVTDQVSLNMCIANNYVDIVEIVADALHEAAITISVDAASDGTTIPPIKINPALFNIINNDDYDWDDWDDDGEDDEDEKDEEEVNTDNSEEEDTVNDAEDDAEDSTDSTNNTNNPNDPVIARYHHTYVRSRHHARYNGHLLNLHSPLRVSDVERIAAQHNLEPEQLPIVYTLTGGEGAFTSMLKRVADETPHVAPVVLFIRTTQENLDLLCAEGYSWQLNPGDFIAYCTRKHDQLCRAAWSRWTVHQREAVSAYLWARMYSPIMAALALPSDRLPLGARMDAARVAVRPLHTIDVLEVITQHHAQVRSIINAHERKGYAYINELISSVQRGKQLWDAYRAPQLDNTAYNADDKRCAYLALGDHWPVMWQHTGTIDEQMQKHAVPTATAREPLQYAIIKLLETPAPTAGHPLPPHALRGILGENTTFERLQIEYNEDRDKAYEDDMIFYPTPWQQVIIAHNAAWMCDVLARCMLLDA